MDTSSFGCCCVHLTKGTVMNSVNGRWENSVLAFFKTQLDDERMGDTHAGLPAGSCTLSALRESGGVKSTNMKAGSLLKVKALSSF